MLSALSILNKVSSINAEKLSSFILSAQVGVLWLNALHTAAIYINHSFQDPEGGGISDRPGNMVDVFHTIFGIAGVWVIFVRLVCSFLIYIITRTFYSGISWFDWFGSCLLHACERYWSQRFAESMESTWEEEIIGQVRGIRSGHREKSLLISLFLRPWIMLGRHGGNLISQCSGWLQLYKTWRRLYRYHSTWNRWHDFNIYIGVNYNCCIGLY